MNSKLTNSDELSSRNNKFIIPLLLMIYFLSGACSLMDQVVWVRLLKLSLGNTVYASTIVVSVFMGGLGLGAYIMSLYADKIKKRLRLYSLIELLITITVVLSPIVLKVIDNLYRSLYVHFELSNSLLILFQIIASSLALLVPSILMGSTFPLLGRELTSFEKTIGIKVGKLYAINTLGAAIGCFVAGFVSIRLIGVMGTLYLAAGLNIIVALGGFLLSKYKERTIEQENNEPITIPEPEINNNQKKIIKNFLLAAIFLSGFISIGYEIIWMKSIVFLLGGPTYVFSAVLTVYLLGNVIGALIGSRLAKISKNPFNLFGITLTLLGIFGMVYLHFLHTWQNDYLANVVKMTQQFWTNTHIRSLLFPLMNSFVLFLIPSILMGMGFPLALQAWGNIKHKIAQTTGQVYSINTLGAVLGGIIGGFVFIPLLGVQYSILSFAILGTWFGTIIMVKFFPKLHLYIRLTFLVVPLFFTIFMISMPSDLFYKNFVTNAVDDSKIIAIKEGVNTVVSVHESADGSRIIATSAVKVAGDRPGFRITQKVLGHLGFLINKNSTDAVTVGFGSGETSKCMTLHDPKNVHVIEIAPELIQVSIENFDHINLGKSLFERDNVNVIFMDAKNYLHLTENKYDLIVTDAINPKQVAENASLYTLEYFQSAYKRLKPGGYIGCWLPIQEIPVSCVNSILQTFAEVFPYISLWLPITAPSNYDFIYLVGSIDKQQYDPIFIEEQFKIEKIAKSLDYINYKNSFDVLNCYLGDEIGLRKYLKNFPINSDYFPYVEFNTDVKSSNIELRKWFSEMISEMGNRDVKDKLYTSKGNEASLEQWYKEYLDKKPAYDMMLKIRLQTDPITSLLLCSNALSEFPSKVGLIKNEEFILENLKYSILYSGVSDNELKERITSLIKTNSNHGNIWLVESWIRKALKDERKAYYAAARAYNLRPDNVMVLENFGNLLIENRLVENAIPILEKAYYYAPENPSICSKLARAYLLNKDFDLALFMFNEVITLDPRNASAYFNTGIIYLMKDNIGEAKKWFEKTLQIKPDFEKAREQLRLIENNQ
jgi:spermidine synthase